MGQPVRRKQCPTCQDTGKDNLVVYDDGSSYCFACGDGTNSREINSVSNTFLNTTPIPLSKRGINKETVVKYGVGVTTDKDPVLVFPFYKDNKLVAQKIKTLDKEIKWIGNAKDIDWMGSRIGDNRKKNLYITEGEEDCLAVYQTLGAGTAVTSLVNGAGSVIQFIKKYHAKLSEYDSITLVFDQDEPGRDAAKEFAKHFPVGKVAIVTMSEKDACDMLVAGKSEELKWACLHAKADSPEGVLCIGDLSEEYFDEKFEPGIELPFPILNYYLGGLRKGELTMISAGTGLGKSTWCTNLIYDLVVNKGLKVADIKLEETQRKSIYTYLAMHTNNCPRKLREDPSLVPTEQRTEFISTFKNLYVHNHFGSLNALSLLNVIDYYATILKVDFIFLDHISIAVSGTESSRDGERKDIDKLVTKLRELIDRTGVGFICVSHLKNAPNDQMQWEEGRPIRRSDLRGSGSLAQLSDNILGIEGCLTEKDKKENRTIKLIKTRYGDTQEAYCDTFIYNILNGRISIKSEVL